MSSFNMDATLELKLGGEYIATVSAGNVRLPLTVSEAESGVCLALNGDAVTEAFRSAVDTVAGAFAKDDETSRTITVFTDTDDHEGCDNAVTQALTQSKGAPLHVQGPTRHVSPDRYMGGYTTRYAWTFTPHP